MCPTPHPDDACVKCVQELSLSRGTSQLLKEHGPFTHLRKAAAAPLKQPKQSAKEVKDPANGAKDSPKDKVQERIIYTDASGQEFEVTADRKRKLQVRHSGEEG